MAMEKAVENKDDQIKRNKVKKLLVVEIVMATVLALFISILIYILS